MGRKRDRRERGGSGLMKGADVKGKARVGVGAALLGLAAWFTGGLTWDNALEWIKTLAVAGGLALTARWAIGEPYKIPSGSMEPTLHGDARFMRGDRVFVNKWVYGLRFPFNHARIPFTSIQLDYAKRRLFQGAAPERWDIVVFKSVEKNAKHGTLVKRVVGLPGERVHIENGRLFINGKPIDLPEHVPDIHFTREGRYGILPSDEFSLIPPDHYFLLGDNSGASRDGRYWGWVPNEHILGRVSCIAWPPARWRDFTGFSRTWWWRTLVAFLALIIIWRLLFGRSWRVHGPPPDADLAQGDHLYVDRLALGVPVPFSSMRFGRVKTPSRGRLVLYKAPPRDGAPDLLLGRVAGFPGERISFEDGVLHIDGAPAAASPFDTRRFPAGDFPAPFGRSKSKEYSQAPPGHVFIVADRAEAGQDGRTLGWTPMGALVGVVKAVWWPPRRWRRVK